MVQLILVLIAGYSVSLQGGDGRVFACRQAWYDSQIVHYVPFTASDMALSNMLSTPNSSPNNLVDFTPALLCTLDKDVLGDVYFIDCGQTVVFSTEPGREDYTALWRVHYLEWKKAAPKKPVNSEQKVLDALADGSLVHVWPISVLDATMVVNSQGKPSSQARGWDPANKLVFLPLYKMAYGNFSPYRGWDNTYTWVLLTESSDQDLARDTGAYYTPRLRNAADCTNKIYAFVNPTSPNPPLPISQLPVMDTVSSHGGFAYTQTNLAYTPLEQWLLVDRGKLVPTATVGNAFQTLYLLNIGVVGLKSTQDPVVTNSWIAATSG